MLIRSRQIKHVNTKKIEIRLKKIIDRCYVKWRYASKRESVQTALKEVGQMPIKGKRSSGS